MQTAAGRPWVRSLLFLALYSAAVVAGRESRPDGSEVALAWPAAGISVWWLMDVARRRLVIDCTLLLVLTAGLQLLTGLPTAAALLFGATNLGHGLLGRWMVRRSWPDGARLTAPADVLRLLAVAAVAGAFSGTVSTLLAWQLLGGGPAESAVLFLARNAGTTFVVLAVVLSVRGPHSLRDLLSASRAQELALMVGLVLAFTVGVHVLQGDLPVGFLIITLPVWAGARLGVPRAAAVSALVGVAAVETTVSGVSALVVVSSLGLLTAVVQVFTVLAMLIGLMLATLQSQRDEVARRLRASEALLRRTSESALVGTALVDLADPDRVLQQANPAMRELFPGAGEPLSWRQLLCEESEPQLEGPLADMLHGRSRSWNGEVRHRLPSGSTLWAQVHVSTLAAEPGEEAGPRAAVVQMLDITARKDAEAHLAHLALHDPLTGLPNRLLLRDRLEHDLAASARGRSRVALVYLDLDGFKAINDTLGHDVGDVVLGTTAERLQEALRPGDTVGRMGGDEFVACCADVLDGIHAREIARRLVAAIEPPMVVGEHLLRVSASAGVALSRPGDGSASMLRAADTAMYAAKRGGRGRVVTAWEDPTTPIVEPAPV